MRVHGRLFPRRRRLFWRIFLHSVAIIVLMGVASGAILHMADKKSTWRQMGKRAAALMGARIDLDKEEQPELQRHLSDMHHITLGSVAVYRTDGRLLAQAGDNPPQAIPSTKAMQVDGFGWHRQGGQRFLVYPVIPQKAYLIMESHFLAHWQQLLLWLVALLVLVALMSLPLLKTITRPLERITVTARQLGAGDLSARTQMKRKDEVGALASTLDDMAERLEKRIRNEKELLANVSHEIRTPLARIKVALELCLEKGTSLDEITKHLQGIADDAAELDHLLEDVLSAARLDVLTPGIPQNLNLRLESSDPQTLVLAIQERFASMHPERQLIVDMADGLPDLRWDATLIRRSLDNLLDNAVKYSTPDTPVELNLNSVQQTLVLEVKDRGIGIEENDLVQIFEPFFRSDSSRTRNTGGTGLGLTLCKRIIEAHGGTISANKRPGGGTVMHIELSHHP